MKLKRKPIDREVRRRDRGAVRALSHATSDGADVRAYAPRRQRAGGQLDGEREPFGSTWFSQRGAPPGTCG